MKKRRKLSIIRAGTVLVIFTALLLFEKAFAQQRPPAGFDPKESFEQFMTDCTKELNLTNEQEIKMRSILKEQFTEQKAYREKMKNSDSKDFRAMKKEMKRIREKTDAQLNPVLTEEQMKKFQSLREERRAKFRKEMRKRRRTE
jgi:Spy/CpxP family protein refolding chaperone